MKKKQTKTTVIEGGAKDLCSQYSRAWDAQNAFRNTLEEKEALLIGDLLDEESQNSAKSQVFDPRLSTIVWERAARVTAQVPVGAVQAMSKKDFAASGLMQFVLDKYVYKNANTDYPLNIKTKLFDFYSLVYGSMCVITDYMITPSYTGPDYRLIPIRDVLPQPGRTNVDSCDYVFIRSTVSKKWLMDRDKETWKNVDKVLEKTAHRAPGMDEQTYIEGKYQRFDFLSDIRNDRENVELITKYERDKWTTFTRDGEIVLREIENPHGNNRIPVVKKDCFPLMDRFFGLGEFERSKTLQYAINSLINLYMDGVKMSIFPPMTVYLPDIMPETLVNAPGAMYMLKNPNANAIRQMDISPRGIDTFQSTYQFLNGAIQNAAGTTDTSVSPEYDPGMGKTPAALRLQASRQNARDNWDREMLDISMEQVFDNFVDLISRKQAKPLRMVVSKEDIDRISQYNPTLVEMFESGKFGEVTIKPEQIKGNTYKFFIEKGSSMKPSAQEEGALLKELLGMLLKFPQFVEQVAQTGDIYIGEYKISVGELMKRIIVSDNVSEWEKILQKNPFYDQQQNELAVQNANLGDPVLQELWDQIKQQPGITSSQGANGGQPGYPAGQPNYTAVQDFTGQNFGEGLV